MRIAFIRGKPFFTSLQLRKDIFICWSHGPGWEITQKQLLRAYNSKHSPLRRSHGRSTEVVFLAVRPSPQRHLPSSQLERYQIWLQITIELAGISLIQSSTYFKIKRKHIQDSAFSRILLEPSPITMGVGSNCIWNTYRYLGIDVIPVPICDGYIGALRVRMWERSENPRLLSGATQKRNPDIPSRS